MLQRDAHFWIVVLIRGLFALLVGSLVLVIPDMARTMLVPLAIAISVLGLATYGVIDSTLILISSFMAGSRVTRIVLLAQGSLGILIGLVLLFVVFDRVRLEWFLLLAATQAICAGVAELVVAKHAGSRAISRWNDATAIVAFSFGAAYIVLHVFFAAGLNPHRISSLVYGYLAAFGIAQCITAARMLYADRVPSLVTESPVKR
ncbi:MAG TPA: hypothetical protein VG714_07090 [Acidobacteriaceae bacterium]|nr:hypothetical protein [Acidobacteriaceae bacterium]